MRFLWETAIIPDCTADEVSEEERRRCGRLPADGLVYR